MLDVRAGAASAPYVAGDSPRVIVAGDARFAAVIERGRVVVVELAGATPIAEYAIAADAQLAWLGVPSRLLVISRGPGYQTAELIDPAPVPGELDAVAEGETRVEATARIAATTDQHALLVGARGAMLVHVTGAKLVLSQFHTLKLPTLAGPAGRRFVAAIDGTIEEWDPARRAATRRVRLRIPLQNAITAVGGSERCFWMVTRDTPSRIDVIAHAGRGHSDAHELPEPIASVASHPQRDLLACIGRETGRLYVVALDGQLATGAIEVQGLDTVDSVAFCPGQTVAMVVARAGRPIRAVGLDGRFEGRTAPAVRPVAVAMAVEGPSTELDASSRPLARELDERAPARSLGRELDERAPARALGRELDEPSPPPLARTLVEPMPPRPLGRALDEPSPSPPPLARGLDEPAAPPRPLARTEDDSAYRPLVPPRPRPAPRTTTQQIASLGTRSSAPRCSKGEYQALLEHYRRGIAALAVRAIARDWDSGRLAFPTQDRPPHEAEVLGIAGRTSGLNASRLVAATDALDEAKEQLRIARAALAERLSPLEVVCREYGVGTVGEQVLLHVVAPALWGELARLYGILANDPARTACDEHLLWQLLGDTVSRRELARELDVDAPLVRHGLLRAGDRPRPFQPLVANPILVKLLGGYDVDDDEPGIDRVDCGVTVDGVVAPGPVIERALADLAAAPAGLGRVVVRGRIGSGRRTLLAALARLAGRSLALIDVASLVRDKRLPALSTLLQHASLRGWLPCVDGLDTIASDDAASRSILRELIRDHHGPVAVRVPHHMQPPLDPDHVLIELPMLSTTERAEQWRAALTEHGLAVRELDTLAARFVVGTGTIRRVTAVVSRGVERDTDRAVEDAMRQHLESKLGTVATRVTRLATWSQVVLPTDIQDSIVELVARIRHRRTVFDTWGFDTLMATSRGVTALFQGGPGTGKTMVAGAIANELGLDLYRIDLSRVMSKWIGETEQNLGKVFDAAEEGQAVILFDEADSLFAKRTEVRTSVDRYANLEVNYLLQRLDSFEGVAILTTNFGTAIDQAFKRRMSVRLTFPFPDDEARERLWRVHLPEKLPIRGDLDLAGLARRYQMSGGYIRNAALRAAFLAAEEGTPLTQHLLERAVRAEFREGGKLGESGVLE